MSAIWTGPPIPDYDDQPPAEPDDPETRAPDALARAIDGLAIAAAVAIGLLGASLAWLVSR